MPELFTMKKIAHIESVFPDKFGIPRQSGLTELESRIVFEPEFRVAEAFRGIDGYSHLWLLWIFSGSAREDWSPTVRPPRLGGNTRMGVFATRSPFRPNPIGLSSVKLTRAELKPPNGPVLYVTGADLMDRTPIIDIKPYLPYADLHPEAVDALAERRSDRLLEVGFADGVLELFPPEQRQGLIQALAQDPRPGYQDDPDRVYNMRFMNADLHFKISEGKLMVFAADIIEGRK